MRTAPPTEASHPGRCSAASLLEARVRGVVDKAGLVTETRKSVGVRSGDPAIRSPGQREVLRMVDAPVMTSVPAGPTSAPEPSIDVLGGASAGLPIVVYESPAAEELSERVRRFATTCERLADPSNTDRLWKHIEDRLVMLENEESYIERTWCLDSGVLRKIVGDPSAIELVPFKLGAYERFTLTTVMHRREVVPSPAGSIEAITGRVDPLWGTYVALPLTKDECIGSPTLTARAPLPLAQYRGARLKRRRIQPVAYVNYEFQGDLHPPLSQRLRLDFPPAANIDAITLKCRIDLTVHSAALVRKIERLVEKRRMPDSTKAQLLASSVNEHYQQARGQLQEMRSEVDDGWACVFGDTDIPRPEEWTQGIEEVDADLSLWARGNPDRGATHLRRSAPAPKRSARYSKRLTDHSFTHFPWMRVGWVFRMTPQEVRSGLTQRKSECLSRARGQWVLIDDPFASYMSWRPCSPRSPSSTSPGFLVAAVSCRIPLHRLMPTRFEARWYPCS